MLTLPHHTKRATDETHQQPPRRKLVAVLQVVGAVIVSLWALWFLFGIPAFLLFGILFK